MLLPSPMVCCRGLCSLMLLGLLAAPAQAADAGHTGHEQPAVHEHPAPPAETPPPGVGLEEKMGAQLPGDIRFTDETGRVETLAELIDRPTLLAPVYFNCPNVCHFLQGSLAGTIPHLRLRAGEGYRILSVSFDERETPAQALHSKQAYLNAVGPDFPPDAWSFLTGDAVAIRAFTEAIGFGFQRQGEDFLHPVTLVVVSADRRIVRYLHGTQMLSMDVNLALVEAAEGRVSSPIRKLVSYCFSYDPHQKRYVFNLLRISATVVLLAAGSLLLYLVQSGRRRKGD